MRPSCVFICFLFAVCCSADLNKKVRYFETLKSEDLHVTTRTKRSADGQVSQTKHVSFRTLGRKFDLVLQAGSTVLSRHFRAVTVDEHGNSEPFNVNPNDFYTGHLAEDSSVTVNAHFEDGILSSSINLQHDTYMVEPAWRHHKPSDNFTMISYRGSDVNWDEILPIDPETGKRTKMKDGIRLPEGSARNTQQSYGQNATNMGGNSRHKRGAVFKNTCPLLVVADFTFFRDMGNNRLQTTASFLISTIQKVNAHYQKTVFDAANGFYNMGFQIDEMKIHVKFSSVPRHYNADKSWHYNEKLYAFSRSPQNHQFCLAHLFTSYPMADNVLGLAFIAPESVASAGGICSTETDLQGTLAYPRTGWSSAKNVLGQALLSLQHEIVVTHGHNWGAEHDSDDVDECNPDSNGKYIMWPYAVPGYEENNKFFSPCSKRGIAPVLRSKSGYCFRNFVEKENTVDPSKDEGMVKSLCGNGIVEENEDCDVGFAEEGVEDKCCNRDCKFKPNAQCSDFNSPCCKQCQIAKSSVVCEEKNELACKGEAFCDGKTLNCSAPSLLPDNTSCIDNGRCFGGRCLNFCQLRGLSESKTLKPCLCTQNTTAMCRRCCLEIMQNDTKGECLPTAVLQEDGRTCAIGTCDEGVCAKIERDLAHRIFKFIKFLTADALVEFMRTNIVGTVIVLSLLIWIPASWVVSCVDKRQIVENENDLQRWLSREHSLMGVQRDQMRDFVIKNSRFTSVQQAAHINGLKEPRLPSASSSSKRVTFKEYRPAYTDWLSPAQCQNSSRRASGWVGANTRHEDYEYGPANYSGIGQCSEDTFHSDAGHILSHWRYSEYAGSISGSHSFRIEEEVAADLVHVDSQCTKDPEEDNRRCRSTDVLGAQEHSDENKQLHDQHKNGEPQDKDLQSD